MTQNECSTGRSSRRGLPSESTDFGMHSQGRPAEIKKLMSLIREYWRQHPELQLSEIIGRLIPSPQFTLDGPDLSDKALIEALSKTPELQEKLREMNSPDV